MHTCMCIYIYMYIYIYNYTKAIKCRERCCANTFLATTATPNLPTRNLPAKIR